MIGKPIDIIYFFYIDLLKSDLFNKFLIYYYPIASIDSDYKPLNQLIADRDRVVRENNKIQTQGVYFY